VQPNRSTNGLDQLLRVISNPILEDKLNIFDVFNLLAGIPFDRHQFGPDTLSIQQGTPIIVANEGGEPHTFTEVKHFGGGFIDGLNNGEPTV